jgi:hypothetical protein
VTTSIVELKRKTNPKTCRLQKSPCGIFFGTIYEDVGQHIRKVCFNQRREEVWEYLPNPLVKPSASVYRMVKATHWMNKFGEQAGNGLVSNLLSYLSHTPIEMDATP